MKKAFELENLECAHCAQKIQDNVSQIEGVTEVNVSFLLGKLTYEVSEENDAKVEEIVRKTIANLLPDVEVNEI